MDQITLEENYVLSHSAVSGDPADPDATGAPGEALEGEVLLYISSTAAAASYPFYIYVYAEVDVVVDAICFEADEL